MEIDPKLDRELKIEALNQIIRATNARIAADVGGYRVKTGSSLVDSIPNIGTEHPLIELFKYRLSTLPSDPSEAEYGDFQEVRDGCEDLLKKMRSASAMKDGKELLDKKLAEIVASQD